MEFFFISYPSMFVFIVWNPMHLCFYFNMHHFFLKLLQLLVSQLDKKSRSCKQVGIALVVVCNFSLYISLLFIGRKWKQQGMALCYELSPVEHDRQIMSDK